MISAARRRRITVALAMTLGLTLLGGCAAEPGESGAKSDRLFTLAPVQGWQPPEWTSNSGIEIVADAETGTPAAVTIAPDDLAQLNPGRIRNDSIGFAARYIQLPMDHKFNGVVTRMIRDAISQTGGTYAPEVYPASAGLSDRGCLPGSLAWTVDQVLTDPATGTDGGAKVAMTCEVLGMFGNYVEIGIRTVSGMPGAVADRVAIYDVDVVSGDLVNVSEQWNERAAGELWGDLVTLLRRQAGGLGNGPNSDPPKEQLKIVQRALTTAKFAADGSAIVTVSPGFMSPELEALGSTPSDEPISVHLPPALVDEWETPALQSIDAQRATPFVGLPNWTANPAADCSLVPCVAVTYDDGPSEFTPLLLNTLWEYEAPVTFFVLGRSAQRAPDAVQREFAEGHEIGSHTMTHPRLTKIKKLDDARNEVLDAAEVIEGITGGTVTSFRPPYGEVNPKIIDRVKLPAILWSIDTNDWQDPGQAALVERSAGAATPGDIILFHDTHFDSVDSADEVIQALRDRGFVLTTLTEMFGGKLPEGRVNAR